MRNSTPRCTAISIRARRPPIALWQEFQGSQQPFQANSSRRGPSAGIETAVEPGIRRIRDLLTEKPIADTGSVLQKDLRGKLGRRFDRSRGETPP